MSSSTPISGVVLAAGRSTRMGRDKALLESDGQPLWQRQRDILAGAGVEEIFLSARPDQLWTRRADGFSAVLHDTMPGCGPLVGITAALERATHSLVAVVAIDLPAITSEWFVSLRAECTDTCGRVARNGDFFEPLAAIYPREMKWLAWEALARGDYSLQRLVANGVAQQLLRIQEVAAADAARFANWNRPER